LADAADTASGDEVFQGVAADDVPGCRKDGRVRKLQPVRGEVGERARGEPGRVAAAPGVERQDEDDLGVRTRVSRLRTQCVIAMPP